jgi:RNAse (barnase) inhibitor barstar
MLAAAFDFPGYYGKNWDAFWECINDTRQSVMPRKLVVKGFNVLEKRLPRDAELLRTLLADYQNSHPGFEVVLENI